MSSLPHGWADQVDARNHGKYDKWLQAKRSNHKEYAEMPLTMGYYSRADIPFYYRSLMHLPFVIRTSVILNRNYSQSPLFLDRHHT
jgi:hypothetical protein